MRGAIGVWGAVPIALLQSPDLSVNQLRVFVALSSFQGTNETCWPSRDSIAERAGIRPAAVSKALSELEVAGWIIRSRRPHKHTTNMYQVLFDIETVAGEETESFECPSDSNIRAAQTSECPSRLELPLYENNKVKTTLPAPAGAGQLEEQIKEEFLSKAPGNTFTNWPKEVKGLRKLITSASAIAGDDAADLLRDVLDEFSRLKASGDRFWSSQPFLPSVVASDGIFPRIIESMSAKKQSAAARASEPAVQEFVPDVPRELLIEHHRRLYGSDWACQRYGAEAVEAAIKARDANDFGRSRLSLQIMEIDKT